MTRIHNPAAGPSIEARTDQAGPATAHMTPVEMLALLDPNRQGERTPADAMRVVQIVTAASFGSAAYEAADDADQGTAAMLRAFLTALTALIDPMSPDLDYLRMDPAAAVAARAAGGAA